MPKKIKYLLSSILSAVGFYLFISLPYESRYYGLLVGFVLIAFCFWFGLGIIFDDNMSTRLMSIILPEGLFIGFGLFSTMLPINFIASIGLTVFFGLLFYMIFLVENVFLVAIGNRTPPLYRAAYTVSLIILLLTTFFLFDSMLSYKLNFWLNGLISFLISLVIFLYQFYSVTIELSDDGKNKNMWAYALIPALLIAQLALVFSFWPVGIFKGSIYLVSAIYIICGLMQADIRERLFRRTWLTFIWIGVSIMTAVILMARWR